jgi:hypothetical protein
LLISFTLKLDCVRTWYVIVTIAVSTKQDIFVVNKV